MLESLYDRYVLEVVLGRLVTFHGLDFLPLPSRGGG